MKNLLLLVFGSILLAPQCNKNKVETPLCVTQKIEQIKDEPKWNPPAEVNEYLYLGKPAYLITSDCCDQYTMLYDESCNYICAPSGGITGKGDGKCSDFYTVAKHQRLVWKDPR